MDQIRLWIERFLRGQIGYEGDRALRVLVGLLLTAALGVIGLYLYGPMVAVAGTLALVLIALRAHRGLRLLPTPVLLIGVILLVAAWLLPDWLTIPRFTTEGPVVRSGVAAVVVCGEKQRGVEAGLMAVGKYAPEPRTGSWWPERKGNCTVWYHRPPGFEQRFNRHERAQDEQAQ